MLTRNLDYHGMISKFNLKFNSTVPVIIHDHDPSHDDSLTWSSLAGSAKCG